MALVHGIPWDVLITALTDLDRTCHLTDLNAVDDRDLCATMVKALKRKSGQPAQYVELSPLSSPPPMVLALVGWITELSYSIRTGHRRSKHDPRVHPPYVLCQISRPGPPPLFFLALGTVVHCGIWKVRSSCTACPLRVRCM